MGLVTAVHKLAKYRHEHAVNVHWEFMPDCVRLLPNNAKLTRGLITLAAANLKHVTGQRRQMNLTSAISC